MKQVILYDPFSCSNVPELFNTHLLKSYNNCDKEQEFYLILIHNDVIQNLKNSEQFFNDYISFMKKWDMPYIFFPYYAYFNKALPDMVGKPNPRVELKFKGETINIVNQICHGCLILNIKKLKTINFQFNTNYPILYYLQDLAEQCYQKQLWISNCWFLDRFKSWEDLIEITCNGLQIDNKKFQEQKTKYAANKVEYHPVQTFIDKFKEKFNK